jgi:hypothetical protein
MPRLVQCDDKLPPALAALGRGKQDHGSGPAMDCLLLAVGAADQMMVGSKTDKIAFHVQISAPPRRDFS